MTVSRAMVDRVEELLQALQWSCFNLPNDYLLIFNIIYAFECADLRYLVHTGESWLRSTEISTLGAFQAEFIALLVVIFLSCFSSIHNFVRNCVNLLVKHISSLPWIVFVSRSRITIKNVLNIV